MISSRHSTVWAVKILIVFQDLGDGPVGKVVATQAWCSVVNNQNPHKNLAVRDWKIPGAQWLANLDYAANPRSQ